MQNRNSLLFLLFFLVLFENCVNRNSKKAYLRTISNSCNNYDDTTLLYCALNLNENGEYTNLKVNQGKIYPDIFYPSKFDIEKSKKHIDDTDFVFFKIFGKNNKSIICLHPYQLITGFKVYNEVYYPILADGRFDLKMEQYEFNKIMETKKIAFAKYCDSINSSLKSCE
jgi:hypothetical protein